MNDRYDFILDFAGRLSRVQVKSAHSNAINGYTFHCCGNLRKKRYTPEDIDFIMGYVVPDDVWYVIPSPNSPTRRRQSLSLERRRMSRFEIYREAWDYIRNPESFAANV